LPDRIAGAGVRDAEPWEIAAAVTERTAAVVYVANASARPMIEEVARVAKFQNTCRCSSMRPRNCRPPPISAAFSLPGLTWWPFQAARQSAARKAPASSVAGANLIMSAVLSATRPRHRLGAMVAPPSLIDKNRLAGLPPHGIGRQCKVGKETIVGLLVALRRFLAENEQARHDRFARLVKRLDSATGSLGNARTEVRTGGATPRFILTPRGRLQNDRMDGLYCAAKRHPVYPRGSFAGCQRHHRL